MLSLDSSSASSKLAEALSDSASGPDGGIYGLSDQSRTIALIEQSLDPDESKVWFQIVWKLPKDIEKPEGLVIPDELHAIVAQDIPEDRNKPNLFLVELNPTRGSQRKRVSDTHELYAETRESHYGHWDGDRRHS